MVGKILSLVLLALMVFPLVSSLDVSTQVLDKYKVVEAGSTLQFQVTLENIAYAGRRDISLEYVVKMGDLVFLKSRELKAVETQASFVSSVTIPENARSGTYTIEVIIDGQTQSSDTFIVEGKSSVFSELRYYLLLVCFVILVVGLMIWREVHKIYELDVRKRRR